VFAKLGMATVHLPELARQVGENVQGRPGGAVSLAVGMAYIFGGIPVFKNLMGYWYHFAIMFEAVFILTAVDTGTRVGRFFLQEMLGQIWPKLGQQGWWPGIILTSAIFTGAWGYLVYTGDISTIWPLFGIANQLLAACALIVCTTMLLRMNKLRYAWVTAVPGFFMAFITFWAGYLNIVNNYLPAKLYLLSVMAIVVMLLMAIVFVRAVMRWVQLLKMNTTVPDNWGEAVLEIVPE
jgi:carbon starvation protein